jgi:hypothetical protein
MVASAHVVPCVLQVLRSFAAVSDVAAAAAAALRPLMGTSTGTHSLFPRREHQSLTSCVRRATTAGG